MQNLKFDRQITVTSFSRIRRQNIDNHYVDTSTLIFFKTLSARVCVRTLYMHRNSNVAKT